MVNAGAAEIRLSSPPALSRFLRACGEIAERSFAAARLGIRSRRDLALVGEQLDQVGVRTEVNMFVDTREARVSGPAQAAIISLV